MEPKEIKWSCVICLERNYPMTLSPCGHGVCSECVNKIDKCPECRADIVSKQPNYELGRILGLDYVIEVNKETEVVSKKEEEKNEDTEESLEESIEEAMEESLENNEEYIEWEISLKKMFEDGEKRKKYQDELRNYHNKLEKYALSMTLIVAFVLFILFVINLFMEYGGVFGIVAPIAFMSIYMFVGYWISEYILKKTCIKAPKEIVYN
jgi:cation transport ATPase